MREKLESSIQSDIIKRLKRRGGFVYKHCPDPAGIPDIHYIEDGHSYFFEVKRNKDEKPSPLQKYQMRRLKRAGATVKVVWTWKQVAKVFK